MKTHRVIFSITVFCIIICNAPVYDQQKDLLIQDILKTPESFLNKEIEFIAFFQSHGVDGPWLCADPRENLKRTLPVKNVGACEFIQGEGGVKYPHLDRSSWVKVKGTLRRGTYRIAAFQLDIENKLFIELKTVTSTGIPTTHKETILEKDFRISIEKASLSRRLDPRQKAKIDFGQ